MEIYSISPIDGRYKNKTTELENYFSELSLINSRIIMECEYYIFLNHYLSSKKLVKKLSKREISFIRSIYLSKEKNALEVKKIEFIGDNKTKPTNHDVKAVEYYLKKTFAKNIKNNLELIHFGLTSEDVNNIAYSIMISSFIRDIYLKKIDEILKILKGFSLRYAINIFPARTHGQFASPTTFGKEMRIFYERLNNQKKLIENHKLTIKLNGAVGNYNSFVSAYPQINWLDFSKKFTNHLNDYLKLNFELNYYTTQIESHDCWVYLFDRIRHINSILIGLSQDMWRYISDELLILKPIKGEVGSSTMPYKVNPINFENAEGNLQYSNAILEFLSSKLPISRMQRDLSDSTVERNIGVGFAHSIIGYSSLIDGLSKIDLNKKKAVDMINSHPEVYAEAIQTILRKHNISGGYEMMKELTRGRKISKKDLIEFVKNMNINKKIKEEILNVVSKPYIGKADFLAKYKL